jgi:Glycosyl hydrolases family 39
MPARPLRATLVALLLAAGGAASASEPVRVDVRWDARLRELRTSPTLQVVVTPLLMRSSAIHRRAFDALGALGCERVRYIPWFPYPRLSVAALEPPADERTSWDFSLIDPITTDFFAAMAGRPAMVDFSVIPQWMFRTDAPVPYPADPAEITWDYQQGTELRDATLHELAGYYARLASWYTRGGFTDEHGRRHDSPHNYSIDYWEVLNEPDAEHRMTPEQYTQRYDAIVAAIRDVSPQTKFVGPSLAFPLQHERFLKHFLKRKHHRPGTPIDMISYHAYGWLRLRSAPGGNRDLFLQADEFLRGARRIDAIRQRLWPEAGTAVTEIGALALEDQEQGKPGYAFHPIPAEYWNRSAAFFAYLYTGLARLGVDVAAQSALAQYPGQFPSATMLDWESGEPNARYRVLELLCAHVARGDQLVETNASATSVRAQAFVRRDGSRRLLLINTGDAPASVTVPDASGGEAFVVDVESGGAKPPPRPLDATGALSLGGFGVAVVALPARAR